MLCIGQRHELDFNKGDFEDMDKIGAIYLGHGVWMYTHDAKEGDLGKESEKTEYCFCALGCHCVSATQKEGLAGLMALGIAVNLQKTIGGYVYWNGEYEGDTFYLGGVEAFRDRTEDWWCWPEGEWWEDFVDDTGVFDWRSIAESCTKRNNDWYKSELERARLARA